jgi:large subunit ribosomal protein L24
MNKIKSKHVNIGDRIQITTGTQKGVIGTISSINVKKQIVTIDTVTPRKKNIKSREGGESKEVELQVPIHISNVMLWDTVANLSSKIGSKVVNGEKKRYFKKSGNLL